MGNKFSFVFGGQQEQQCELNILDLPSWIPRGGTPTNQAHSDDYGAQWWFFRGQGARAYPQQLQQARNAAWNRGFWYERSLLPGTTPPPATAVYGSEWLQPAKFSQQQNYVSRAIQQLLWQQGFITVPPPDTAIYGSEYSPFRGSVPPLSTSKIQQLLWQQGIITVPPPDTAIYGSEYNPLHPYPFLLSTSKIQWFLWQQQGTITQAVATAASKTCPQRRHLTLRTGF